MEVTDQKMSNPPGYKHNSMSVTSNIGKDTERLINITKNIVEYFIKRAREDEYIAKEMRICLTEADKR